MKLAGFLIVLHVTPHLTIEDSPLKLSHGTSYQTTPHSSQPQSIWRTAIQAATGFGFISGIIYLAFLCTLRERVLKATRLCQISLFCYEGHCTWLTASSDCQRTSWKCWVKQPVLPFQVFRGLSPEHRTTTAFATAQVQQSLFSRD